MKLIILFLTVFIGHFCFAKVKSSDFNQMIEKQAQSQNETHLAMTKEMSSPLIESSEFDNSPIIISSQQTHIDPPEPKDKIKKIRFSSSEEIEENDFNRLDQELESAN